MRYLFIVYAFIFAFSFRSYAYPLYWFTSAGIKKPAQKIAKMFNRTHSSKVIVINGGTGKVLNEMLETKKGDVYTPVDSKFLRIAMNNNIIVVHKRFLKLTPIFALSKTGEKKIKNFYDLFKPGVKIASGNPKVMALGTVSNYIINKLPKDMSVKMNQNIAVRALNVFQIIGYVKNGAVDAGIMLDKALIRKFSLSYIAIPKQYSINKYGYLTLISYSKQKKKAKELFDFILKHLDVYKEYGFEVIYR